VQRLAIHLELAGRYVEAVVTWHRVHPAGACGHLVASAMDRVRHGIIRSALMGGRCAAAVPSILESLDWDESPYGTNQLRRAGFDLARLYRGATATRNRSIDLVELEQLVRALPDSDRYVARLRSRGREDWDRRVSGIEGLVDTARQRAPELVFGIVNDSDVSERVRAINAVGELLQRVRFDPCTGLSSMSRVGYRFIRPLDASCATRLRATRRASLERRLVRALADPDPNVRMATVGALTEMRAVSAVPALERLSSHDPFSWGDVEHAWPVREAARDAIGAIQGPTDEE
jgi:HEAT repeat protein